MDPNPLRGEIWRVDLNPTIGSEINKVRPALILSSNAFARVATRIVIPITSWQERFEQQLNKVKIPATSRNGLNNDSAADVLQVRCVALARFVNRLGVAETAILKHVAAGVVVAIDYTP